MLGPVTSNPVMCKATSANPSTIERTGIFKVEKSIRAEDWADKRFRKEACEV
jgi:hypothetical protein